MIVLRSTHEKTLQIIQSLHQSHIDCLNNQIADLRRLVFIQAPSHGQEHPIRVANAILDGAEVMPKADPAKEAEDLREANRILAGDYDNFEDVLG